MQLPFACTTLRAVISELCKEILDMVSLLRTKASCEEVHVCLVLDGDPLYAKRAAHRSRSQKSRSSLKAARKLAARFLTKPVNVRQRPEEIAKFKRKFCAYAAGWVRWFPDIKRLVEEEMSFHGATKGCQPGQPSVFSIVTAVLEADPKCVDLANRFPRSIIFSCDGDLLVYPYADSAVVCWSCLPCRPTAH